MRVPPGTSRGYEAAPEGPEILVIGAPNLGRAPREYVDGRRDWWVDFSAWRLGKPFGVSALRQTIKK